MAKKSHEDGGRRSTVRHAGELTGGASLALLIVSFLPEGSISPFQATLMGTVLTGGFSQIAKLASDGGFARMLKTFGVGSIVLLMCSGCAFNLGVVTPHEYLGANGETIIACELKGVQFGLFDGGVCQNVEGGQVGNTFVELTTGLVEAVGRILGALLSPFGGASSALLAVGTDTE